MKKLDMTGYIPTELPNVPKIGWDDPNEKEYTCANCGGLVGVPGRIYGLVANWCMCGKALRPGIYKNNEVEDLKHKLEQIIGLFEKHLDTMSDINVHMGYKFTQPLINTRLALKKLK
jgi:hypothetical protein